MADEPVFNGIDLQEFLATAGRSFTGAQRSLQGGTDTPVTMMLSSAELELKVAVGSDSKGKMLINPISSQDIARGTIDPGMISTLRINLISSIGDQHEDYAHATESDSTKRVPDLTGLTVEESIARLKAEQWNYEAHAANSKEIKAAGKATHGKVLRQLPKASAAVDPQTNTVHFWLNLGSVPVQAIDGIGEKMAENLHKIGIRSVGELSLAPDADHLASLLHMGKSRARDFVNMADLMSRLTVLGLKDEVVELLVKGVGIRTMEQLAKAAPTTLHKQCRAALDSLKVRTPQAFKLTLDAVKEWIAAAANSIRDNSE